MRTAVVMHPEPAGTARVQIQDPSLMPGSRHTRVEVATEGEIITKNDGMKTRVTMGAAVPAQLGAGVGDALNTRVVIESGDPLVNANAARLAQGEGQVVMQKTPHQLVEELEAEIVICETAIGRAEKRLEQTHEALANAQETAEWWDEEQAGIAAAVEEKRAAADAEASEAELQRLDAIEGQQVADSDRRKQSAERRKLEEDRRKLDADRAKLQADKAERQLAADKDRLETERAQLEADQADLLAEQQLAEADAAAETDPGSEAPAAAPEGLSTLADGGEPTDGDTGDPPASEVPEGP